MKSWKEMMAAAKQEIALLSVAALKSKMDRKEDLILIDCREAEELQEGHIAESVFIPRGVLEMTVERHFADRGKNIVIYCAGGGRSALAAQSLKTMGYTEVASMEGGFGGWRQAGYPIEK